jgi:hypothetical protein
MGRTGIHQRRIIRADDCAFWLGRKRQPKIEHFDLAFCSNENVAGLYVAMDNTCGVGGVKGIGYLNGYIQQSPGAQRFVRDDGG